MDRNHNDSFFMGMAVNPMTAAGSNVQPAVPFEQFDQIAVISFAPETRVMGAVGLLPQISRITGIINGRLLVFFWM